MTRNEKRSLQNFILNNPNHPQVERLIKLLADQVSDEFNEMNEDVLRWL